MCDCVGVHACVRAYVYVRACACVCVCVTVCAISCVLVNVVQVCDHMHLELSGIIIGNTKKTFIYIRCRKKPITLQTNNTLINLLLQSDISHITFLLLWMGGIDETT